MSEIDSLEIQIQSKSEAVNNSLDNVIKKLGLILEGISAIGKNSGLEQFAKEAREATKGFANISNAAKGMAADMKPQVQEAAKTLEGLAKYKDLGKGFKFSGSTAEIQKQIDRYSNSLQKAKLRKEDLEAAGKTEGKSYDDSIRNTIKLENVIESLKNQLSEIQSIKPDIDLKISRSGEAKQEIDSVAEGLERVRRVSKSSMGYDADAMSAVFGEQARDIEDWSQAVNRFGKGAGRALNGISEKLDTDKIKSFREQLKRLQIPKINTENIAEMQKELDKAIKRIGILKADLANGITMGEIKEDVGDSKYRKARKEIALTGMTINALQEKLKEIKLINKSGGSIVDTSGSGEAVKDLNSLSVQIQNMKNLLSQTFSHAKSGDLWKELSKGVKSYMKNAKYAIKINEKLLRGGSAFEKLGNIAKSISSKMAKLKNSILGVQKQTSKGISLGSMLGTSILFSTVFQAIGAVKQAIKEGSDNLVQYSGAYNNSISSMVSSLTMLKNAFASAFSPIVNVVTPYITAFINMISTAANKVGQFFSALTGKSMAVQAVPVFKDYAAGLGDASSGTDKLNDSTKKLNKTLSVLGFDALNQLQGKNESGDAGNTSNGSGAGTGVQDMFETILIEGRISDFAEKVKNIFSQLFAPLKESWSNEGQFVMDSWKYALGEIGNLVKDVGRDFMEVWQQPETVGIFENLLHVMGDIGLVAGNLARQFREAWDTNSVGLHIFENIRDILAIVTGHIKNAADYTVQWSETLDFYPLLESINSLLAAIEPLTDNIGAGLEWFYTNVLLSIAGWTIEDAIPTFLDMLSAWLGVLNNVIDALKPLAEWLLENFLKPLGEWTGDLIISAMEKITELLKKVGNWVSKHQVTVQNFAIVLGSFALAWGVVNTVVGLWSGISAIATAATTALGAAISFLTSPIGLAVIAIGSIIAIGTLLYKNWETISATAKKVWDFVKQKFQEFDNFLQGIFTNDWLRSFGIIGETFNAFFRNINDIWNSIKEVFSGITTFIKGVFTGDWRTAWEGIKQIFSGIWNGLVSIVKSPINSIIGIMNGLLNGMASAVNGIADMLNSMRITIPDWVPGIGGGTLGFSLPKWNPGRIPYLAEGGILKRGQVGILEGNGAEAVVPLERNRKWISRVSEEMSRNSYNYSGGGGIDREMLVDAFEEAIVKAMMNNQMNQRPINVNCYAELKTDDETLARAVAKGQQKMDYRMNPTPRYGY